MKLLIAILFTVSTASAFANCTYEGKTYPPGTKVGPFTCQEDGTWK